MVVKNENYFLLFKQAGQVSFDLCSEEVSSRHCVVRSLRNLCPQELVVAGEQHLEKVLEVEVPIFIRVKVLHNQVAISLCGLFNSIFSIRGLLDE